MATNGRDDLAEPKTNTAGCSVDEDVVSLLGGVSLPLSLSTILGGHTFLTS